MTDLQKDWQRFESDVVPAECTPNHRGNMRDAFYAGAWISFEIISRISGETADEDVATLKVEAVVEEMRTYFEDRKAGRI